MVNIDCVYLLEWEENGEIFHDCSAGMFEVDEWASCPCLCENYHPIEFGE